MRCDKRRGAMTTRARYKSHDGSATVSCRISSTRRFSRQSHGARSLRAPRTLRDKLQSATPLTKSTHAAPKHCGCHERCTKCQSTAPASTFEQQALTSLTKASHGLKCRLSRNPTLTRLRHASDAARMMLTDFDTFQARQHSVSAAKRHAPLQKARLTHTCERLRTLLDCEHTDTSRKHVLTPRPLQTGTLRDASGKKTCTGIVRRFLESCRSTDLHVSLKLRIAQVQVF